MVTATKNQTNPKVLALTAKVKIVVPKQALVIIKPADNTVDFFLVARELVPSTSSAPFSTVVYNFGSVEITSFLSESRDSGRVSG